MIRASVIVPARNAEATLPRTLERLADQVTSFQFEVIVVDDGSTDRTAELASAAAGQVRLLTQDALGPAAARNRGVAAASGSRLAFCDADCFPEPGWLEAGVQALSRAGLVQGRVLPEQRAQIGPFDRTLWINSEVGLWESANLFVTRELFDQVGGFEEWLEPVTGKAMAEDVWFGWKVKRAGGDSAFCEDALAYHAVFRRSARDYIGERRRCQHFPELAAKMPELRGTFFYRRWFLNRRTATFDAAVLGGVVALALRRGWPLTAAMPFAREVASRARICGRLRPGVPAADVAADAVTAWALLVGSWRARSPVL